MSGSDRVGPDGRLMPDTRAGGPVAWMIAIMIGLTILAAGAALSLRAATASLGADLAGRVTVQIVTADPEARRDQSSAALRALRRHPMVTRTEAVPDAEIERLLSPWLGSGGLGEDFALPAMIDVDLGRDADPAALTSLRTALRPVAPDARVDAHARWLRPLANTLASLQWLALGIALLMAGATGATVVLAARSLYASHADTIELIHLLGATDRQIAGLIQRQIARSAALGGVIGALAAGIALALLSVQLNALQAGLLGNGLPAWQIALMLILIPAMGVGIAMLTARVAVMGTLRKSL